MSLSRESTTPNLFPWLASRMSIAPAEQDLILYPNFNLRLRLTYIKQA